MRAHREGSFVPLLLCAGCGLIADLPDGRLAPEASSAGAGGSGGSASVGASGTGGSTGSRYAAEVLSDEPWAYWRLGDSRSGTAVDASGNGNDGLYQGTYSLGAPGAIAGDDDHAVTFNGAGNARVDAGPKFHFVGTEPYTLEAWIRPGASPISNMIVCGNLLYRRGPHRGYMLGADPVTGVVQGRREPDAGWAGEVSKDRMVVDSDRFYHLAVTFGGGEGGVLAVYQDGELVDSTATTFAIPEHYGNFLIGDGDNWVGFTGDIDEVAVYNVALSQDRLRAHFGIGAGLR